MKIEVLEDADAVADEAATLIADARPGRRSPRAAGSSWRSAAGTRPGSCCVPWRTRTSPGTSVHVVQVDERVAPAGHPDRNLTHLRESLLDACPLRAGQIHAMPVEAADLEAAAARYALTLARGRRLAAGARPRAPRARARRPHRLAGSRRSGPRRHRRGRGADRDVSGPAPDDVDLSDPESRTAGPVAGDRRREGGDAGALA